MINVRNKEGRKQSGNSISFLVEERKRSSLEIYCTSVLLMKAK